MDWTNISEYLEKFKASSKHLMSTEGQTLSQYLRLSNARSLSTLRGQYIRNIQHELPTSCKHDRKFFENILTGNSKVSRNVNTDTPDTRIAKLARDYQSLKKEVYFSILIPLNDAEAEQRRHENRHVFTLLDRKSSDDDSSVFVYNYGQFKNEICWFMTNSALNAIEVVIIINGHGKEEGLEFTGQEVVPWCDIIQYINSVCSQRKVSGVSVPVTVHLVIAACNSVHAQNEASKEFIKVKSLAIGCDNNETTSVVDFDRMTGTKVEDAHHLQLEEFITKSKNQYGSKPTMKREILAYNDFESGIVVSPLHEETTNLNHFMLCDSQCTNIDLVPTAHKQPTEMYDMAFFLAGFPISKHTQLHDSDYGDLNTDFDRECYFRYKVLSSFLETVNGVFPNKKTLSRQNNFVRYRQFLQSLQDFWNCAKFSISAKMYIVLDGHGTKEGLCIHLEGRPIPWTDISNDMASSLNQNENRIPVTIVLDMCHGHNIYDDNPPKNELMTFIALSTQKRSLTSTLISTTDGYIDHCENIDLNRWAKNGMDFTDIKISPLKPLPKNTMLSYRGMQIREATIVENRERQGQLVKANLLNIISQDTGGHSDLDIYNGRNTSIKSPAESHSVAVHSPSAPTQTQSQSIVEVTNDYRLPPPLQQVLGENRRPPHMPRRTAESPEACLEADNQEIATQLRLKETQLARMKDDLKAAEEEIDRLQRLANIKRYKMPVRYRTY